MCCRERRISRLGCWLYWFEISFLLEIDFCKIDHQSEKHSPRLNVASGIWCSCFCSWKFNLKWITEPRKPQQLSAALMKRNCRIRTDSALHEKETLQIWHVRNIHFSRSLLNTAVFFWHSPTVGFVLVATNTSAQERRNFHKCGMCLWVTLVNLWCNNFHANLKHCWIVFDIALSMLCCLRSTLRTRDFLRTFVHKK